jgi:hypothetical protein
MAQRRRIMRYKLSVKFDGEGTVEVEADSVRKAIEQVETAGVDHGDLPEALDVTKLTVVATFVRPIVVMH